MTKNPTPLAETMADASCPSIGMSPYVLVIEDDHDRVHYDKNQAVIIASFEEAADFMRLLGNICKPVFSCDYLRIHPEHEQQLMEIRLTGCCNEAPFSIERAAFLMKKLPLDIQSLNSSPIALKSEDTLPATIDRAFVHKTHQDNVLISQPFLTGWVRYFNIYPKTNEINFDHQSDHLQGILLLEALRQVGIASAHLQGLPLEGKLALLNFDTNFFKFIEPDSPIVCRCFCSFTADKTSEDKEACIYIQVFQWGRVCADNVLRAFSCISPQRCESIEQRLKKVSVRQKEIFESKIRRIHEMTLS